MAAPVLNTRDDLVPTVGENRSTGVLAGADAYLPYLLLAVFFGVSMAVRPILPTAETRYLSVAWEMWLNNAYFVPTLNSVPYFHKPPLLFWLIDLSWRVFGVGRGGPMLVLFVIASLVVYLTVRLAKTMFPDVIGRGDRATWITAGSAVFVIYATLIYFDLLLTACVLAFMIALIGFARGRGLGYIAVAGLCVGLGILAKGPVVLVHVIWPIILYHWWRTPADLPLRSFFRGIPVLVICGILPLLAWLGPALAQMDKDFAYNLLWNQSAGRVSGSLEGAHPRSIFYYLPYLPIMIVPWSFAPDFWRTRPWSRINVLRTEKPGDYRMLRLLALWSVFVLVTFSLISGKQPHYIVPEFALVAIGFAYFMAKARMHLVRLAVVIMFAVFGVGQVIASNAFLERYDLAPITGYVAQRRDAPLAFAGEYQGELNFLARLTRPMEVIATSKATSWINSHPDGYLIMPVDNIAQASGLVAFSQVYEEGYLVVLTRK